MEGDCSLDDFTEIISVERGIHNTINKDSGRSLDKFVATGIALSDEVGLGLSDPAEREAAQNFLSVLIIGLLGLGDDIIEQEFKVISEDKLRDYVSSDKKK